MANAIYKSFKAALMRGEVDLLNDPVRVALVSDSLFDFNDHHSVLSDVSGVVSTGALSAKLVMNGTFGAGSTLVANSLSGQTVYSLVLFSDSGNPATSDLIAFFDSGVGLPLYLQGSDVTIVWPDTGARIFEL